MIGRISSFGDHANGFFEEKQISGVLEEADGFEVRECGQREEVWNVERDR
jgi:hypothetical protein